MSTYDCSTLHTTLSQHLIKDKLIDLFNRTFLFCFVLFVFSEENTLFGLQRREFFSILMYTRLLIYGLVKESVMSLFIIWIDLERNVIGKLQVFRWELIVLLLLQILVSILL